MGVVEITYFSDVLCIWAYVAQARIDAVKEKFGDTVRIEHRFCSVFGDTARKITSSWKDKGGYDGFNSHFGGAVSSYYGPFRDLVEDAAFDFGKHASVYESSARGEPRIRGNCKPICTQHFRSSDVGIPLCVL